MKAVQASAGSRPVRLVDVDQLLERLTGMAKRHEECGRISHSLGVRSAITMIKRMKPAPIQPK